MKRGLSTLVLIAALAFAVGFVLAPWFAFRDLRAAAMGQDVQAMTELVDFNAVRASLRGQLHPEDAQAAPIDIWRDPLGAMRQALAPAVTGPDIETYLTPQAMTAMAYFGRWPTEPRPKVAPSPLPLFEYWGFTRCRIRARDPEQPDRMAVFTFERKGLFTWKLTQIRLPPRGAAR